MAFGDADRGVFVSDFAVTVVVGASTTTGNLDDQTVEVLQGQQGGQLATEKAVRVKTGSVSPTIGGAITVDGVSYTVRDIRELPPDGRFTRIELQG